MADVWMWAGDIMHHLITLLLYVSFERKSEEKKDTIEIVFVFVTKN